MVWIQQIPTRQSPAPCPFCGATLRELSTTGRVGCAKCYEYYREALAPYIDKLSNGAAHIGCVPSSAGPDATARYRLQRLETELRCAIAEQRFERCAELRDEISLLKEAVQ